MQISVPSTRVKQRRGVRRSALAVLLVPAVLLVFVLALQRQTHTAAPAVTQPVAPPTLDPTLVLRPRTSPITLRLDSRISLQGTLAPTIPGLNVVYLAVKLRSGAPVTSGHLTLTATMPGMAMPPITAVLHAQGRGFTGAIRLPMFGVYLAVVTLRSPTVRLTGTMNLTLPLPAIGSS